MIRVEFKYCMYVNEEPAVIHNLFTINVSQSPDHSWVEKNMIFKMKIVVKKSYNSNMKSCILHILIQIHSTTCYHYYFSKLQKTSFCWCKLI